MYHREREFYCFLENLLQDLIELIPNAETGSILVKEGDLLRYKAAVGFDLEKLQQIYFDIASVSFYENKPHILTDLDDWNLEYLNKEQLELLERYGDLKSIQSTIKFVLHINKEVWGVFNIDNLRSKFAFNENDVKIVEKFKSIAEKLIEAKLIYDQLENHYSKLTQSIELNRSLFDKYSHDLRNLFQIMLFIIETDATDAEISLRKMIKNKMEKINKISFKILLYPTKAEIMPSLIPIAEKKITKLLLSLSNSFPVFSGVKITIFNKEKITESYEIESGIANIPTLEEYYEVVSANFPFFEDYDIVVDLYFENKDLGTIITDTEKKVIQKEFSLLFLLSLQIESLDSILTKLNAYQKEYNTILKFFQDYLKPFLGYISEIIVDDSEFREIWFSTIHSAEIIIDSISILKKGLETFGKNRSNSCRMHS
ncbi:MAG: GAF domain-containing protein [Candidatus Hodarchaeales archaeon]